MSPCLSVLSTYPPLPALWKLNANNNHYIPKEVYTPTSLLFPQLLRILKSEVVSYQRHRRRGNMRSTSRPLVIGIAGLLYFEMGQMPFFSWPKKALLAAEVEQNCQGWRTGGWRGFNTPSNIARADGYPCSIYFSGSSSFEYFDFQQRLTFCRQLSSLFSCLL